MSYQLTYCNMEQEENVVAPEVAEEVFAGASSIEEIPAVEEVVEETEQA